MSLAHSPAELVVLQGYMLVAPRPSVIAGKLWKQITPLVAEIMHSLLLFPLARAPDRPLVSEGAFDVPVPCDAVRANERQAPASRFIRRAFGPGRVRSPIGWCVGVVILVNL